MTWQTAEQVFTHNFWLKAFQLANWESRCFQCLMHWAESVQDTETLLPSRVHTMLVQAKVFDTVPWKLPGSSQQLRLWTVFFSFCFLNLQWEPPFSQVPSSIALRFCTGSLDRLGTRRMEGMLGTPTHSDAALGLVAELQCKLYGPEITPKGATCTDLHYLWSHGAIVYVHLSVILVIVIAIAGNVPAAPD